MKDEHGAKGLLVHAAYLNALMKFLLLQLFNMQNTRGIAFDRTGGEQVCVCVCVCVCVHFSVNWRREQNSFGSEKLFKLFT